jgi:hypothetical protein
MTNPPMNWGYPRTWEGFLHALTRGQYERANPTSDPLRFLEQLRGYFDGAIAEFNLVYLLIGLIPHRLPFLPSRGPPRTQVPLRALRRLRLSCARHVRRCAPQPGVCLH